MRSAFLKLVLLSIFTLLMLAIRAPGQINSGQVRYPPVCKVSPTSVYLPYGDTCANLLPANTGYPGVVSNGSNGLSMGGNLATPALNGGWSLLSNSSWGNGTNNIASFFNNTAYCNGSVKACAGFVDASYAATEQYNNSYVATSNFSPGPSQAVLMDLRSGGMKVNSHDPALNSTNYNDNLLFNCANTTFQGYAGSGNSAEGNCLHLIFSQHSPGFSMGNSPIGPGGWSVNDGLRIESTVNTPGISQIFGFFQSKAGVGDNTGPYGYTFNYGGALAFSDEGNVLSAFQGGEAGHTYAGTITTGSTGATSLTINCTADCPNVGDGRYLMLTQTPVATGHITNVSGNNVTIDSTVAVSPFWGTLNADVLTPNLAPNGGTQATAMTFAVTKTGGAGAPTAGDLICFSSLFHEQAKITSVSGSGPYTITANLRHAHQAGSLLMDGGACGTFIEVTGIDQTPQGQLLRWPEDVIGSTSANTLVYVHYGAGGLGFANATYSAINLSNVGGVVSFSIGGNPPIFNSGATVTFTAGSDTAFNGTCTNLHLISQQLPFYTNVACSQASSNGHGGPATATITWGANPYAFNLWAGAEVIDVQDYTTSPPSLDGHLTVEPNGAAWTPGATVEQPHHYAQRSKIANNLLQIWNPNSDVTGLDLGFVGAGFSGSQEYSISTTAASHITNYNNQNIYVNHGGFLNAPNAFAFGGLWESYIATNVAPEVTFAYIGAPANGLNDPTSSYNIFEASTVNSGAFPLMTFRQFQNTLAFNSLVPSLTVDTLGAGGAITFIPISAPSNEGSYATTGGSLPDSTTYYYYVVSLSPTFAAAARSPEITVTTGSNAGNNRIRLMWTRPAGAQGYAVCRGSTSGSEQQIYTAPGGNLAFQTWFDDMGNLSVTGGCPNPTSAIRGGVEQADHIGVNSPGTGFEAQIVAPAGYSANQTFTLPAAAGTLCTTGTCPGGSGIANIQISTGTTAIPANTCTTNTAATMTGLLTTSAIVPPTPTSSTTGVVGWGSSGGLGFSYYVTAGTFNWSVCNATAASITPGGSLTWNVGAR